MTLKFFHLISSPLNPPKSLSLDSNSTLDLASIINTAHHRFPIKLNISQTHKKKIASIHQHMLDQVSQGVPIYGTTSAYGGRAGRVLNQGQAKQRLKNATKLSQAITHVDISTGDPLPKDVVRAAVLIRANMLLSGHSAIRLSSIQKLLDLLNADLTPLIGRYGTVSASGDLAQNGRVLSVLLHQKTAKVFLPSGRVKSAKSALTQAGIQPLTLLPKEGLALVNGDNFSTAAAALIAYELVHLTFLNLGIAALTIQALKGSMRNFHPLLQTLRPHPGQKLIADQLRALLTGSRLALQDLKTPINKSNGQIIQDAYSIRTLPQYFGSDIERLSQIIATVTINANSVSDNPLWTSPSQTTPGEKPYQWVSGGNFLAMHMSESIDSLRKIAVHIIKQNDRHLARLIDPRLNNGLPANLSDPSAISQCTFKGLQTQMGMFEVYATRLADPLSTSFGTHEELNQDLTSHALSSAIITWEVLKIARLAIATNLISACQAIDLRGGPSLLSPATKPLYTWLRSQVPYIKKEQPLGHFVESIADNLTDPQLTNIITSYLK